MVTHGDHFRVRKPNTRNPKKFRIFVVVSRQELMDSGFSTVIYAPIYLSCEGLKSQVPVGVDEGLKHDSCIFCDERISLPKSMLTDFIGRVGDSKSEDLNAALRIAVSI